MSTTPKITIPGRKPQPTPAELMAREQARYRREQEQRMWEAELADTHRIAAYEYDREHG